MDLDPETHAKIIATHTHVKLIREELVERRKVDKDHDKRIRALEQSQQFTNGKLTIIILVIGTIVTIALNLLIHAYNKLKI